MNTFVVTSLREGAGKTTIIVGLAKALNGRIGYIKPLGERLLYRKKRLRDYDASLIAGIFLRGKNPEEMSIAFHHAKLRFMLDEAGTRERLLELQTAFGKGKGTFFVECGKEITYGASVHLDALTVAEQLDAQLVVIAGGDDDAILDDLAFLKKRIHAGGIRCSGVIINKVKNIDDFRDTHLPLIKRQRIDILGIVPYCSELSRFSVAYLADRLFANILCGEVNMGRTVKEIFVGSMSVAAALVNPRFKEEGKVVITSGDRADMIAAALSGKAAAVVLTGNILPAADLIEKAARTETPLLLVSADTAETVKQIEGMEALLTGSDTEKIARIEQLVQTNVDLHAFSKTGRSK